MILDGTLSNADLIQLLKLLVRRWTGQDITIDALDSKDIGQAAIAWAATRVADGPLRKLVANIADGTLSPSDFKASLISWVHQQAPQIEASFTTVINGPVNTAGVVHLAVASLVASKRLATAGNSPAEQEAALLAAITGNTDPGFKKLITAIASGNWVLVAQQLLAQVGVKADEELLQKVFAGTGAPAILAKILGNAIPALDDAGSAALADTVISLFRGGSLASAQSEQAAMGLDDREYAIYRALRRIFYAASLAAGGLGPVVPSAAMAQPHLFAMAAIQNNTLIKDLAPSGAVNLYKSYLAIFMFPGLNAVPELAGNPKVQNFKTTMPFPADSALFNARSFGVTFQDAIGRL